MALNEFALDELGLSPRWVSKGTQASRVAATAAVEAAIAGELAAPVAPGAGDAAVADAVAAPAAQADARRQSVQAARPARLGDLPARAARADAVETIDDAASVAPSAEAATRATAVPVASDEPPPLTEEDFAWFDAVPALPGAHGDEPRSQSAAPRNDVASLDWDALAERVEACTRCRLCEKRTKTVFGVGDREADWMLIGEAPGENEDRQGEPFVGQAGKLLDNMLRALSLARGENVYIANVIKCRPPGNRNPEPDEVARCEPYLQRQVALVKPKIIVALGRFAAQSLLKSEASIASLRGRVHEYEGVPVIVTYHPAYLLRSLHDKSKAWADLCLARDIWRKADGGEK
ncbi:MAG: uracil-DNA glycosylase [Paraburkholderia sp.]|uniref:uracil-DNA glycosylase n=1 Tax=Paraburkholderia sp. TaxID=1926495 RepID=UPI0011F9E6DE|nr:uracil-DNA glycosylase [Paraburkholderia sp.]TAM04081.1 MAG: uracil-DNA glycosylase [Paraburkholderia sp.]TAM32489.1 MAG: uracil-DNA glycosylase [Paraburkholderia sp.]